MHGHSSKPAQAVLVLATGEVFVGTAIGKTRGSICGELVFNTSLTGYQEILTDPSYKTQLITLTNPEIGNYGIRAGESESESIHAHGLIVKHYNPYCRTRAGTCTLAEFLDNQQTLAITGIDTRRLTRQLRTQGSCMGILSTEPLSYKELLRRIEMAPDYNTMPLAESVTTAIPYEFTGKGKKQPITLPLPAQHPQSATATPLIVVIDYGVKLNILRLLKAFGAQVYVLPCTSSAAAIISARPNGILLSNGPGDPQYLTNTLQTLKKLIGHYPIFGICLGHQLLGLANNYQSYKLSFGHHGANHPIKTLGKARIAISSQNHGYALKPAAALNKQTLAAKTPNHYKELSHVNLNDLTVAGHAVPAQHYTSVQYHPEGAPGPQDSYALFEDFIAQVRVFMQQPSANTKQEPTHK